jgi:hypothetical protein
MNSASIRRHLVLALPFVVLWVLGLFAYEANNLLVFEYGIVREAKPYEWVPYGLPRLSAEVMVLYVLLWPATFRWSWGRVLIALAIFIGMLAWSGPFNMHAPGWVFVHDTFLGGICFGLLVLLVVCVIGKWLTTKRSVPA